MWSNAQFVPSRKVAKALFAGSDYGGDHWAVIASMIETCKLNASTRTPSSL